MVKLPSAGGAYRLAVPGAITCLNHVCRFYPELRREGMSTGMRMGFGPGSEMGMKVEVVESWKENYMYLTRMGGNISINCTAA